MIIIIIIILIIIIIILIIKVTIIMLQYQTVHLLEQSSPRGFIDVKAIATCNATNRHASL